MFHANKKTRLISVVLSLLILGLLLVGCSSNNETAFVSPLTAAESPLAGPDGAGAAESTIDVPEPGTDTGVLVGRIYSTSIDGYLPEYPVYLGEILPLDPGDDYLITLKEKESPQVMSTVDGYVVFDDLPPGEYALIVWLPFSSKVIPDPANPDTELRINIVAGEVLDFGQVEVAFP